jgi:hypothetical protein
VLQLTQGQCFPQQTAELLMGLLEQQHQQLSSGTHDANPAAVTDSDTPAAAADAEAEGEVMEPPEQLLQMLDLTAALPGSNTSSGGTDAAAGEAQAAASAAATAAALQRNHQQALQQFGGVLKQVTNSPACGAAVWGLLGRWNALQGQHLSNQEARLKQVRRSEYHGRRVGGLTAIRTVPFGFGGLL